MSSYRAAKAAEHAAHLKWLRGQLSSFREIGLPHNVMLRRLEEEIEKAEKGHLLLERALRISGLEAMADDLSGSLAEFMRVTSDFYVAGLQHQSKEELAVRELLLKVCHRLGLDWIEDLMVRYSRDLGLWPAYRGSFSIPILFAPPNLMEGVLALPGIHHEFAHSAYSMRPLLAEEMRRTVKTFFQGEKGKLGPLPPKKRLEQEAAFDGAAEYWSDSRLAEIFCDVFAGYVCGPANLVSVIDLHLAEGEDPFLMSSGPHPPGAARVAVCTDALSPAQSPPWWFRDTQADWKNYMSQSTPHASFQRCCPAALMKSLAEQVNELIASQLPSVPRYTKPLPSLEEALIIPDQFLLEEAINASHTLLLVKPDEFPTWWKRARSVLC